MSRLYCRPHEFTLRLRQRMPMDVGFTFTPEQMDALRQAFGDRFDSRHAIDVRGHLHLPWSRYYLVFQLGRDRRTDKRCGLAYRARTVVDSTVCGVCLAGLGGGLLLLVTRLVH